MEVEIVPEPEPPERAALLRALAELDGDALEPAAYRSPWRLAALAVEDDDRYGEATARPLRRPGAARA